MAEERKDVDFLFRLTTFSFDKNPANEASFTFFPLDIAEREFEKIANRSPEKALKMMDMIVDESRKKMMKFIIEKVQAQQLIDKEELLRARTLAFSAINFTLNPDETIRLTEKEFRTLLSEKTEEFKRNTEATETKRKKVEAETARVETARVEAERKAETARLEGARLEAERLAEEKRKVEAAETERKKVEAEAARLEAERKAEAARITEEKQRVAKTTPVEIIPKEASTPVLQASSKIPAAQYKVQPASLLKSTANIDSLDIRTEAPLQAVE